MARVGKGIQIRLPMKPPSAPNAICKIGTPYSVTASFSDADPNAAIDHWMISWGDGSTSAYSTSPVPQVVTLSQALL